MPIGNLGSIIFAVTPEAVQTFSGLSISESANYAEQERAGIAPRLQFIGPGAASASFEMQLRADLGVNPKELLDRLRNAMRMGYALPFVIGGEVIGEAGSRWVIESLSEERAEIGPQGELFAADVSVTLRRQPPEKVSAS